MKSDLIKVLGLCAVFALPTTAFANESEPDKPTSGTQATVDIAAEDDKKKDGDQGK